MMDCAFQPAPVALLAALAAVLAALPRLVQAGDCGCKWELLAETEFMGGSSHGPWSH